MIEQARPVSPWVYDKLTNEIDNETGDGSMSNVLCETPHTARFRNAILPEISSMEEV